MASKAKVPTLTESLVAELEKKAMDAWSDKDPDITYEGKRITLPDDPVPMKLRAAAEALLRKAEDEETIMRTVEVIDAFPQDALVAFNMAMKEVYGWASAQPTMTFFGPIPPTLVTVQTGPRPGDQVQVIEGEFKLPNIENAIHVDRDYRSNPPRLVIWGEVRKQDQYVLKELANKTRDILKTNSIYKGKAIRLRSDEDGDLNQHDDPQFIDTANINVSDLILNPDELDQVSTTLWTPIAHTEACVEHGIPLKRGILLEGPYGTGKTMTAHVTARIAVDNGWTYVLLDDVRALKDALIFAQRYAPAVVFAEDIERVIEDRDQGGNDLLNTIDGVISKNSKIITILTTNFVEKLDQAMLRPGRLDAVIRVREPGPESVIKLIRLYGRGLVDADVDLSKVGHALAGNIPATIREVVERSKLAMIARGDQMVNDRDLLISAEGMKRHLDLLKARPPEKSDNEKLGEALSNVVAGAFNKAQFDNETLEESIDVLAGQASNLTEYVNSNTSAAKLLAKVTAETGDKVSDKIALVKKDTEAIRKVIA